MRRSCPLRWQAAPRVYPFRKPFYDTPYDEDRHRHDVANTKMQERPANSYPEWMERGADGQGNAIGLYRTHPLSKLRGNVSRAPEDIPRMLQYMTQGVRHVSGNRQYRKLFGKAPNPNVAPYLDGEPCPVYGWKVIDEDVTRKFEAPHIADRNKYKPYVGMQERHILEDGKPVDSGPTAGGAAMPPAKVPAPTEKAKPLLKRLFFWK